MILLTGATGFLGSSIIEQASNITFVTLGRKPIGKHNYIFYDFLDGQDFTLPYSNISCIIHCAARVHVMTDGSIDPLNEYREVNTIGTMNLARKAVQSGVKRFIFISTIKVNGESTEVNRPFKFSDERSPEDFYGQSKSEAEVQLLKLAKDTGLEVVIIRPTLVYGPGVKANFAYLLNLVSKGYPLPFGCITSNKRSLVSVTNLVDLIITCIDHPKAANQVFLVSDDHDVSTASMVREMSKALGVPSRMISVPLWCYSLAAKVFSKQDVVSRLVGSLQVDITHTKETLGWAPPQTLQEGFRQTAQAVLQAKNK